MNLPSSWRLTALALAAISSLTACGGSDDDPVVPEETRAQDSRNSFAPSPTDAARPRSPRRPRPPATSST